MGGQSLKFRAAQAKKISAKEMQGWVEAGMTALEKKTPQLAKALLVKHLTENAEKDIAILGVTLIVKSGIDWEEAAVEGLNWLIQWVKVEISPLIGDKNAYIKALSHAPEAEIREWLISFAIAYLIVEHFGEIMTATGNVLGLARQLLGTAAVIGA